MPTAASIKSTTPLSSTSTLNNHTIGGIQPNPPFTKAQLQNTMAGTRTVKNVKEIEQLLNDYPAALELYRTGKYKVKVKCEADIERVILVEKRSNKTESENQSAGVSGAEQTNLNNNQQNQIEHKEESIKKEDNTMRGRSRTMSKDRAPVKTTADENHGGVHTTISSMRATSNAQPKVDNHRNISKDRDASINSRVQSNHHHQQQQQQSQPATTNLSKPSTNGRSPSRDSVSHGSYTKVSHRKTKREGEKLVVPYVPNNNRIVNGWNQPRSMQPYFSNPVLTHPQNNIYMPSSYLATQNQYLSQAYQFNSQITPSVGYPQPPNYVTQTATKSSSNTNKSNIPSTTKYVSRSQPNYNSNFGFGMGPTFPTFNTNQQQYQYPGVPQMYHSQIPVVNQNNWINRGIVPPNTYANTYTEPRKGSKHRTRSVDTGHRVRQPGQIPLAQHHHHNHHQHHVPTAPSNGHHHHAAKTNVPTAEIPKDSHQTIKAQTQNATTPIEKLTIRQLNELFVQNDSSGRLPYATVPNILQRFGINIAENDLVNAAKELDYNVTDPISARRLIHVLVKLGKIARSNTQTHRPAASPTMLPEDREVTDILNQRQPQNHGYYLSAFPHPWK